MSDVAGSRAFHRRAGRRDDVAAQQADSPTASGALPTFLIIGAAKCGTTSLHHYLSLHPEIQMSRRKELRFFGDEPIGDATGRRKRLPGEWWRGIDWYRSWFDPAYAIRGEASPQYSSARFPGTTERIRQVVPEARLIYMVRDPIDRALSSYHQATTDWHETRPLAEAMRPDSHYVKNSRYAERLAPYLEHWPRERIKVIDQAELLHDRRGTLSDVFAFLGADPGFWTPAFEERLNVSARKASRRSQMLHALRRRPWWHHIAERTPRAAIPAIERMTAAGRRTGKPPPSDAGFDRAALAEVLGPDVERFGKMVGREFDWKV